MNRHLLGSLALSAFVGGAAALAVPALQLMATTLVVHWGWTSEPTIAAASAWLGTALGWSPYAVTALVAFAVGFAGREISRRRRHELESIAKDLADLRAQLAVFQLDLDRGRLETSRPMADLMHIAQDFESVLTSLEKRRFHVPRLDPKIDPLGYIDVAIRYADRIVPLLKRGHFPEARLASSAEAAQSLTYAANRAVPKVLPATSTSVSTQ